MFEIGNSLREARVRRGIEFAQAEQATKIRGKYLRSLEDERFELLPSETYVKGFLRTYADYLGLDGQLYVDEFNSRFVTDDRDLRPRRSSARPQRRNRRFETNIVLVALTAIALVTVIVISAWKSSGTGDAAKHAKKQRGAAHVAKVPSAYLTVKGTYGASYVAIHRGGPGGPVVFQGTIEKGETEPFKGKSYWLNVSAPENLVITVGGKRVHIGGLPPAGDHGHARRVAGGLSRPRGAILVTGSELVRGDRTDRNGPYLAQSLLSLGIDPVERADRRRRSGRARASAAGRSAARPARRHGRPRPNP